MKIEHRREHLRASIARCRDHFQNRITLQFISGKACMSIGWIGYLQNRSTSLLHWMSSRWAHIAVKILPWMTRIIECTGACLKKAFFKHALVLLEYFLTQIDLLFYRKWNQRFLLHLFPLAVFLRRHFVSGAENSWKMVSWVISDTFCNFTDFHMRIEQIRNSIWHPQLLDKRRKAASCILLDESA